MTVYYEQKGFTPPAGSFTRKVDENGRLIVKYWDRSNRGINGAQIHEDTHPQLWKDYRRQLLAQQRAKLDRQIKAVTK